ncbi:MAG: SBBP repeat-containing protein, partial [Pyrinomonadaceae bacterium]
MPQASSRARKLTVIALASLLPLLGIVSWLISPPSSQQQPRWAQDKSRELHTSDSLRQAGEAERARAQKATAQLPLQFEANRGQTDAQVKFFARGSGYGLYLTPTEAVLNLSQPAAPGERPETLTQPERRRAVVRMKLRGANPSPAVEGRDQLAGQTNYFIGHSSATWSTDVPTYESVHYGGVYPGIDLIYYGNQRQLEYDFRVAPNADASAIRLAFAGAEKIALDAEGNLVLYTAGGEVRQHKPFVYQEQNGVRQEIAGGYVLKGTSEVGFQIGEYDPTRPLVIDPVLVYSTFLGGNGLADRGESIAVDQRGYVYVTGRTDAPDFSTKNAAQSAATGASDVFVTKLDLSQSGAAALVYSTYLGGAGPETGYGIAVDAEGCAYLTGETASPDFPITDKTFQSAPRPHANNSVTDAFVTKLSADGSALVYSTYLGGSGSTRGRAVAVDAAGRAYVTGSTETPGDAPSSAAESFPTTPGAFQPSRQSAGRDAFVTAFETDGTALLYSTYLGGSGGEIGNGIVIDTPGNAYVTGSTGSRDFPTIGAFQTAIGGEGTNAFVSKVSAGGSALLYSTYLGGAGGSEGYGIAVDQAGHAYVTGQAGPGFPAQNSRQEVRGASDAFVAKLDTSSSGNASLISSALFGGDGSEAGRSIAVDSAGRAYVAGQAQEGLATTANALSAG